MHIARLTAGLALLLVATPGLAEAPQRYAVDVSVVRQGVEVMSTRTLVEERGRGQVSISDGQATYDLTADIAAPPGEPLLGRLRLQARLTRDGEKVAAPTILFDRNSPASMSFRDPAEGDVFITVTPVRTAAVARR